MAKLKIVPVDNPSLEGTDQVGVERVYRIKGLQEADEMPIVLNGNEFDLANLSPEDLEYLLGFPDEAPYLERINDNNQATGA